jgi:predicted flap endonuclease-1-like 5' DNA nuclease
MIHKENLIQKVVKTAGISYNKAKAAYETILNESPAFRKGTIQNVESKIEKLVKVNGKPQIKKVELVKEVAVKSIETVEKIKIVEVKVPIEVVKVVEKIKEVKVIKEVPVEVIKEVIKEVQIIKEVPIEVIKEVTLIKEVEVPIEKEVIVTKEVIVKDEKEINRLKTIIDDLKPYKSEYNAMARSIEKSEAQLLKLQTALIEKPKEIIKNVEVIKEVKVPVIKEVKVKDEKEINRLKTIIEDLKPYKSEYNAMAKSIEKSETQLLKLQTALNEKPKEIIKNVEVIKEVKVKDDKEIKKLKATIDDLKPYKDEYSAMQKSIQKYEKALVTAQEQLNAKPKEIVKEVKVPVVKEVKIEVIKEVKIKDEKAINKYIAEIADLKEKLKAKPKEVIKTVIKEVPVEVIREVEVVKSVDMSKLREMMTQMKTKEVSKTVVGETRTAGQEVVISKREVKAGTNKFDDLAKIEGIGPKIALLLNRSGVSTFKELSSMKAEAIKNILDQAGSSYQIHDPSSWPHQAKLAADGKWDDLKALQDKLVGGK